MVYSAPAANFDRREVVSQPDEAAASLMQVVRLHADAKGKGRIEIRFSSLDQLDGIVGRLKQ